MAFQHADLDPADLVRTEPKLMRPTEVDTLLAEPSKARDELDWTPGTSFEELMAIMVEADLEQQEKLHDVRRGGPGTR